MVPIQEKLFDIIKNPPRDFCPVPLWWWSGEKIETERLQWQMDRFCEGGVYQLVIFNLAPTSPLYGCDQDDPPLFSDEWWTLVKEVCEYARTLGMKIWLYDQLGFSGANFQGQLVNQNAAFSGYWLESKTDILTEPGTVNIPDGCVSLGAWQRLCSESGANAWEQLETGCSSTLSGPHELRIVYYERRGYDYLSKEACSDLIDVIHGRFEEHLQPWFGDVVGGTFQDELPSMPTWSEHFLAQFSEQHGYSLAEKLPELWDADSDNHHLRIDFHRTRCALAEAAFFKPAFEWHERNGLLYGCDQQSPARCGDPVGGVEKYADYMETHKWYSAPGSDHDGDAKIHSSIAHLYDRPRVWIESFHSSGWGGTLEETFDWLLPWIRAGANLYDPHAVYYSTKGMWWEWAAPSTCWRQPYWKHYSVFSNAVSRLCALMTEGEHLADAALLYPATAVMSDMSPSGPLGNAEAVTRSYEKLNGIMEWKKPTAGWFENIGVDYDVVNESSVAAAEIAGNRIRIGTEWFSSLVLPECSLIEENAFRKILAFANNGGRIVVTGQTPNLNDEDKALWQHCCDQGAIVFAEDESSFAKSIRRSGRGVVCDHVTLHRQEGDMNWLLVTAAKSMATEVDTSPKKWYERKAYTFDRERYQERVNVRLPEQQCRAYQYHIFSGKIEELPVDADGSVAVGFDSCPATVLFWSHSELAFPCENRNVFAAGSKKTALTGDWQSELLPTAQNDFDDFGNCFTEGGSVLTHKLEWSAGGDSTSTAFAGYGVRGHSFGPVDGEASLPAVHSTSVEAWKPVEYSLSRGIWKDPICQESQGPKGHVPEEFIHFGGYDPGEMFQFKCCFDWDGDANIYLAIGAGASKQVWLNGVFIDGEDSGYLWMEQCSLKQGQNVLEFRLRNDSQHNINLRAFWSIVKDPVLFKRPERIIKDESKEAGRELTFSHVLHLEDMPEQAEMHVFVSGICRIQVNGKEIGRQGGFEPYKIAPSVKPYEIIPFLKTGQNLIEVIGITQTSGFDVLVDGKLVYADGREAFFVTDKNWSVAGLGEKLGPVCILRNQYKDPNWIHLWNRPHPLPESSWLEGDHFKGSVYQVSPYAITASQVLETLEWTIPPGVEKMFIPLLSEGELKIEGRCFPVQPTHKELPLNRTGKKACRVTLTVPAGLNNSRGGHLENFIRYDVGKGLIGLGDWDEYGLGAYSGGVRYTQAFECGEAGKQAILDLGDVRGSVDVVVNGTHCSTLIAAPYRCDISQAIQAGANNLEITLYNTLASYIEATSPTNYVFKDQTRSGLYGPVHVEYV